MEFRQLEYFVAVAEEANFTRAAARVHVTQPGVSAQIRQLEREFGEDLLDRSARAVRLTKVGAAVLPYARAVLASAHGARQAVDELTGLVRGRIAVGMVTACSATNLFDLLEAFRQRHPDVDITLTEANSDQLIERVLDGELDVAWVGLGGSPRADIETQPVADEELVATVASGHALASKGSVRLAALSDFPLICLPRGSGIRQALDEGCAAAGVHPRVALEASNPAVVAQLAARGLGVGVVNGSSARISAELKALAITTPRMRARVEIAWRATGPMTPAARTLIAQARQLAA